MHTGSHVLGAFNIDFDSFVDNVVFCALIDRVGKYQLAMQKVCAYQPMAESHAADAARGGLPPRHRRGADAPLGGGGGQGRGLHHRWTMLQQALNKWLPRGLEMFGDERGGGTNVSYGLKPMKNAEAQAAVLRRGREAASATSTCAICGPACRSSPTRGRGPDLRPHRGQARWCEGIAPEDLLRMPHPEFFRRRGVPAFQMVGFDGDALRVARRLRPPPHREPARGLPAPAATSATTSTRCASRRGRVDARAGGGAHARAAPRRRRLPVLEVGALGDRRARDDGGARRLTPRASSHFAESSVRGSYCTRLRLSSRGVSLKPLILLNEALGIGVAL